MIISDHLILFFHKKSLTLAALNNLKLSLINKCRLKRRAVNLPTSDITSSADTTGENFKCKALVVAH